MNCQNLRPNKSAALVALLVGTLVSGAWAQCAITGTLPSTLPVMQGGSTAGSTNKATPTCNGGGNDNLWQYTATCTLAHTVSLCGSSYDTILDVFSGDPCLGGASIGCNDDTCALQSEVMVNMTAGTTYWILVDGWNGDTGGYTLNITGTCPIPPCTVAGVIPSMTTASVSGNTSTTGRDEVALSCAGNADDEVWTYIAPCDSTYTFSLCSGTATFDSVLEVFDDDPCLGAVSLGCVDDTCGMQSEVSVALTMGTEVYVVVDGVGGAAGAYDLDVTSSGCPCTIAGIIPSLPSVVQSGDTSLTSSDQLQPSCTTIAGGGDEEVWQFTAPCNAMYTLSLCNGTATFDTVLAVYDADPCLGGMEIACNNDTCGTRSEVDIALLGGTTYYIVIDCNMGGAGPYDLVINSSGCASPWVIDAPTCVTSGGSIDIPIIADSAAIEQGAAQWRLTWDPAIFSLDPGFGTGGFQFGPVWTGAVNDTVPGELRVASWYLPPPGPTGMVLHGTLRLIHSGATGNSQIDGLVEIWTDPASMSIAGPPFFMTSATPALGCTLCALCGDCNLSTTGPDIIDSLTAAQIAVALIVPTPTQAACCDIDSDTDVDVLDSLIIAQGAAGLPVVLMCL